MISFHNILRKPKSRRYRLAGHVARIAEKSRALKPSPLKHTHPHMYVYIYIYITADPANYVPPNNQWIG